MALAAASALVSAESILALTPIAIKKTPLDPISAIWSRVLSSAALGWLLSSEKGLAAGELGGATALGYTNLLHIASSYESFRNLPAGQAMSLLYTYPLWNLVFGSIFGGEKIGFLEFGLIGLAAVGAGLLNTDPGIAAEGGLGRKPVTWWGILMGLVMALSESGMHTILKGFGWRDPAKSVWVVNSSAAVWLAGATGLDALTDGFAGPKVIGKATWVDALLLTAFHGFSMFSGYWLRFFAIPRLSTVTYSILSFSGLLASYLFGLLFLGERPGWISLLGMVVILVSGITLQMLRPDEKEEKKVE